MNRTVLCLLLGLGWLAVRHAPAVVPVPAVKPLSEVAAMGAKMTADDRAALSETYAILSRSIAANPPEEPVFPDTASVRRAHRAALLAVWKGAMGNDAGKYPGLRESLEGYLHNSLGMDDVPLNPELQARVVKTFSDISASLK